MSPFDVVNSNFIASFSKTFKVIALNEGILKKKKYSGNSVIFGLSLILKFMGKTFYDRIPQI